MTGVFYLYVLHSPKLVLRHQRLQEVIHLVRDVVGESSREFRLIMITKHEPAQLQNDLEEINKKVKYEKVGIEEFDKSISMLCIEELSTYFKHRDVWSRVAESSSEDMHLVIEDDTLLLSNPKEVLKEILNIAPSSYDFLSLSMSKENAETMELTNIRDSVMILPSKNAYILSKRCAKVLHAQSETISFNMRHQMSYILHKNPSLILRYPNKRVFLEGSKVGMYMSSIHTNNILIYNKEYMDMLRMMGEEVMDVRKVRDTYKTVAHLQNGDIAHLYGVLLYKCGEIKEAQEILLDAIELTKKQQGLMNFSSDLVNNTINIHEFTQWDLDAIMKLPSKYSVTSTSS